MNNLNWNVLYTLPKHEKNVKQSIENINLDVYLPLYKKIRYWRNKKIYNVVPLFPCYMFVKVPRTMQWQVKKIQGVVRFVSIQNSPVIISNSEIERVKNILGLENNNKVIRENYFTKGDRVKVMYGPFEEFEGEILEDRGKQRLLIRISSIREAFSVEVNSYKLELL